MANFGGRPVGYEAAIRDYFQLTLKDPASAQYIIDEPVRGYYGRTRSNIVGSRHLRYGWLVPTRINAKNSYGALTGYKMYHCWFRGEDLVTVIEPSRLNAQVEASASINQTWSTRPASEPTPATP